MFVYIDDREDEELVKDYGYDYGCDEGEYEYDYDSEKQTEEYGENEENYYG